MNEFSEERMRHSSHFLTSVVSLTQVERKMLIPSNRVLDHKEDIGEFKDVLGANFRFEDTAGHTWHSMLVAIELKPWLLREVNLEEVLVTLAIHDLHEIELKDTIVFGANKPTPAQELKAQSSLMSNAGREARYLELFMGFQKAQKLREDSNLHEAFKAALERPGKPRAENLTTVEAAFAVAADALSPCFVLLSTSRTKAVDLWKKYEASRQQFQEQRFRPVCDWDTNLEAYYKYLLEQIAEKVGWPRE